MTIILTKEEAEFIYDTLSSDFNDYKRFEEVYDISLDVLMDKLEIIMKGDD